VVKTKEFDVGLRYQDLICFGESREAFINEDSVDHIYVIVKGKCYKEGY
jgi:hypothetical protein